MDKKVVLRLDNASVTFAFNMCERVFSFRYFVRCNGKICTVSRDLHVLYKTWVSNGNKEGFFVVSQLFRLLNNEVMQPITPITRYKVTSFIECINMINKANHS